MRVVPWSPVRPESLNLQGPGRLDAARTSGVYSRDLTFPLHPSHGLKTAAPHRSKSATLHEARVRW